MPELQIKTYEIVNDIVLIKWNNQEESYIPLKDLRDHCPCANCSGEKDALGNIYLAAKRMKTEKSYQLSEIRPIGYYAVQPVWADGHDTGIYRYELLKSLSQ